MLLARLYTVFLQFVTDVVGDSAENASDAEQAWQTVRKNDGIQFELPPQKDPPEPKETPEWIKAISEFFDSIASQLGGFWSGLEYVLIGLLALGVLALLYAIIAPKVAEWRGSGSQNTTDAGWRPDSDAARSLLGEADALAEQGDYAAAIRLILQRSIADIKNADPRAVVPSNTAREIGRFDILSSQAKQVFGMIAGHVERGIFADEPVGREAWEQSREAYGRFALRGGS